MTCKVCEYRNRKILERKRNQKARRDALINAIADGKVYRLYAKDEITGNHFRLDKPENIHYTVTGDGDGAA